MREKKSLILIYLNLGLFPQACAESLDAIRDFLSSIKTTPTSHI